MATFVEDQQKSLILCGQRLAEISYRKLNVWKDKDVWEKNQTFYGQTATLFNNKIMNYSFGNCGSEQFVEYSIYYISWCNRRLKIACNNYNSMYLTWLQEGSCLYCFRDEKKNVNIALKWRIENKEREEKKTNVDNW